MSGRRPRLRKPNVHERARPFNRRLHARADTDVARPGLAAALLVITGGATFIAEVAWTRVFALLVGPSTYAFASTVAAFISGLAVGATLGTLISARVRRPGAAIGVLLGLATIAAAWAGDAAGTSLPHRVVADFASSPDISIVSHAMTLALTILPMAIAIGAAFPLSLQLAGGDEDSRRSSGPCTRSTPSRQSPARCSRVSS